METLIQKTQIREVFINELVENDPMRCPECDSPNTKEVQSYHECNNCHTKYRVLKFERSYE